MVQDTSIVVRRASKEDMAIANEIQSVVNLAYRSEGGWTTESHLVGGERSTLEAIQEAIVDQTNLLYLAVDTLEQNKVVGTVQLQVSADHPGEAEIGLLSVLPTCQSRGVGSKLVRHAMDQMPLLGFKKAVMHVLNVREDILGWYEKKLGFERTGETEEFVWPDMLKDKSIHFLVLKRDV
ncbi:acyl-CoA N-acyltransferase [Hesseltinella vesiculosa]|uniref:Acyl-CoA N-acyltransferase n=1 Tax=Hesseltinella vesiculosa TaxID=101127 RepID=A0A1X2GI32_9FUNG|nr:acyl-CoA N-acyltransferase [Hesseltinella vesiculosa]